MRILILLLSLNLWAATPVDAIAPSEIDIQFQPPPVGSILETGQVTDNGNILLASRKALYSYNQFGSLQLKIDVVPESMEEEYIRCQVFDSERGIYTVNLFNFYPERSDKNCYFRFYRANGTLVSEDPVEFYLDGEPAIVRQMTYLGDDLYLFNVWNPEFNNQTAPKTMVLARRVLSQTGFDLVQVGEPFAEQVGRMRQFEDNFTDRWAVFTQQGDMEFCIIAHSMLAELHVYQVANLPNKSGFNEMFQIDEFSDAQELRLENWKAERNYPLDIKREAERSKRKMAGPDDLRRAWYYHFSRVNGLYAMGKSQLLLSYTSPNPEHRFYMDPPKQTSSPYEKELYLKVFSMSPSGDTLTLDAKSFGGPFPGGTLLGVKENTAFVLIETVGDTAKDAPSYHFKRVDISSSPPQPQLATVTVAQNQ